MAESKVDKDKRETVGERAREIEKLVELNQVELKKLEKMLKTYNCKSFGDVFISLKLYLDCIPYLP